MALNQQQLEELGNELYSALAMRKCTCVRKFQYSGKGKDLCNRCRVMIKWEKRNGGESETERLFNATFI